MAGNIRIKSQKIVAIQYLRGIAALAVVICHYGAAMNNYPAFAAIAASGQIGVHVFFLISGFVILHAMLAHGYHPGRFFNFLLRRSIRIDPPYIVVIILTLVFFQFLALQPSFKGRAIPFIPGQLIAHLLYIVPFTRWEFYNHIFWTLSVEFQFYIVTGLLFFLSRSVLYQNIFLLVFCFCTFIDLPGKYYLVTEYAPIFALGMALVFFYRNRKTINLTIPVICFAVIGYKYGLLISVTLLIASLAILYFRTSIPALGFLGEISYSLYLLHPLMLILVVGLLKKLQILQDLNQLLLLFLELVTAICAAGILYFVVEKPAIKLSKSIRLNAATK